MKIALIIIIFFLLNAFFIISNENLALKEKENIKSFGNLYFEWFKNIKDNAVTITGEAIRLEWVPETRG